MALYKSNKSLQSELEISVRKLLKLQRQNRFEATDKEFISLWTMLDLMTLLLVFFIILYESQISSMIPDSKKTFYKPTITIEKKSAISKIRQKQILNAKAQQDKDIQALHNAMIGIQSFNYSIKTAEGRIKLTIGETISFKPGKADLIDSIKNPLRKIASYINSEYIYRVVVSGHTDDTPVHTQQFPSNWELSVARALSVAKFLMASDVDPASVSIEGFGSYDPIGNNFTQEGRKKNRRVEITLFNEALVAPQ